MSWDEGMMDKDSGGGDDDDDERRQEQQQQQQHKTATNKKNRTASSSGSCALTVQTIQAMQESNVCSHPQHCHSFQQVNFSLLSSIRRCVSCEERLQAVLFGNQHHTATAVVRCVACGAIAHRSCALSSHSKWKEQCPVNVVRMQKEKEQSENSSSRSSSHSSERSPECIALDDNYNNNYDNNEPLEDAAKKRQKNNSSPVWTDHGPPKHWAPDSPPSSLPPSPRQTPQSSPACSPQQTKPCLWTRLTPPSSPFHNLRPKIETTYQQVNKPHDNDTATAATNTKTTNENNDNPGLHHSIHPFAAVARALQENIVAHFQNGKAAANAKHYRYAKIPQQQQQQMMMQDNDDNDDFVDAAAPDRKSLVSMLEAARTTVRIPGSKISAAAMVGGIAGGVGGLFIAGPAGAFAGCKLGQVAGALGVIAEGSVTIGVVVASVATGSVTAQQIQEQMEERHVLAMGEAGTAQKVLLVRPNIQIDPVWEKIAAEARASAPKPPLLQALQTGAQKIFQPNEVARELLLRDSDIVQTAEDEIPTADKVLLLVSRILNDKTSLPGHVYRELVEAFRQRCKDDNNNNNNHAGNSRSRRDDAHAVIKHVAATLLEVRPEFASSPTLTELTAAAVEGLVFGQLYTLVWEEISTETAARDVAMLMKISLYQEHLEDNHNNNDDEEEEEAASTANKRVPASSDDNRVSKAALEALRMIPESHTAVDKLHHCVRFLERLSDHFVSANMCAESLLKMACQHLFLHLTMTEGKGYSSGSAAATTAAEPHNMHAQVAFLEEFARDEQLLRGREGYALVTLQAAVHFLDMCTDLDEIFRDDDEEDFETVQQPAASILLTDDSLEEEEDLGE